MSDWAIKASLYAQCLQAAATFEACDLSERDLPPELQRRRARVEALADAWYKRALAMGGATQAKL